MIEPSIIQRATECLQCEAAAIEALIPRLDDNFMRAVEAIRDCKGKIVVTGVGKSGHIGSKIAATLASIGTPAFFLNPLDAYLPLIQAKKIRIIAMSSSEESLLARCADIHLNIAVDHEADPLNLVPTASTTATLALGDALACALVEAKHFQPTDFAQLHPGGDLGRKLLAKVEDVMFTENLPFLTPDMPMSEAIEIVTKGTLGIGIVVENGVLTGIITDGDIRRAMQRLGQDFFTTPVSAIMSQNPKTISKNAKIVEAGEKMNHHSIHTLIVVDEPITNLHVVGVVDSFSCLPGTRFYH